MTQTFKPNTQGYKVLTPDGFKPFAGIDLMGVRPIARLEFEKDVWIECTFDHKLYISDTEYKCASDFKIGDEVLSSEGNLKLLNRLDLKKEEAVYDLIEVADGHRYYANTILSSNCKFLIFDETLISSLTLADMEGTEPTTRLGQVRWYKKVSPKFTYIVSLDPSLGTGGDPAAIQIIELPSMIQVGEWQHNLTTVQAQARILRDICKYINDECMSKGSPGNIYYSIENNTIGEAALIAVSELGEESIPGLFLSEPVKRGHIRRFRKGFNTTHSSKISACAKLKFLIENKKIKINSKPLISELKGYVAKGTSFSGKTGMTDDLVSSLLLAVRMIMMLQDWDPAIYEKMREEINEDLLAPMPIYVSNY